MNFKDYLGDGPLLRTPLREGKSVMLEGGPMDKWIVVADAPALRPDWSSGWPRFLARRWSPGRYVREGNVATWTEDAP